MITKSVTHDQRHDRSMVTFPAPERRRLWPADTKAV